jgi:hypothetical protein
MKGHARRRTVYRSAAHAAPAFAAQGWSVSNQLNYHTLHGIRTLESARSHPLFRTDCLDEGDITLVSTWDPCMKT